MLKPGKERKLDASVSLPGEHHRSACPKERPHTCQMGAALFGYAK